MAEEESAAEESGGGKKNIIIFAVVLLVAIGASVGGTLFFLGSEEAVEVPDTVVTNKPQTAIYHNMRPPYIINYLSGAKPRYLQAEFSVMARNEAAIEGVILHMPLIRSQIVGYLGEQSFLELQTQEGKEAVRRDIVDQVNETLAEHQIQPGIESIYFTNFVLQ